MGTKTRKIRRMSRKLRRHTKRKLRRSRKLKKNKRRSKRSYKFKNCNRPNKITDCKDMEDPITLDEISRDANPNNYVQIDSGHCITNDNWKDLKSFRSPGQPYVISPISRRKIWCEEGRPVVVDGTTTYKTPYRLLKMELDYIAYGLEGLNYRMYSSTLEDYSSKPYVSNSLKTRLLELSLELQDVDPYFTRISRSVTNKLKRAEQLIRIVYVNGVSYFEQQFGIPYVPPYNPLN